MGDFQILAFVDTLNLAHIGLAFVAGFWLGRWWRAWQLRSTPDEIEAVNGILNVLRKATKRSLHTARVSIFEIRQFVENSKWA